LQISIPAALRKLIDADAKVKMQTRSEWIRAAALERLKAK
jgi:metal-responsive CopG/Arc/MetJ family transcriptional regulator